MDARSSPEVDIVIPVWNQPDVTQRCLRSLVECTEMPLRLILIDNASSAETQTLLTKFQPPERFLVTRIRNPENLGFVKAVNQGIRAGSAPWVCLLNNDTVVTPGWLEEMLKVALSDPSVGLVNPTSNSLGFSPGEQPLEAFALGCKRFSGQWTQLTSALGFCLLARRSLLESVGLLDESFGFGYFDDDDLSRKVKAAGFRLARAAGAYVYHEERASFRQLPGNREAFEKNRRLFEERWGKRLRILLALPFSPKGESFFFDLTTLAGEGHWITLLDPQETAPEDLLTHAQINLLPVSRNRWRLQGLVKLLTKRKKPFDLVISYDSLFAWWVSILSWFHRARLLKNPAPHEILGQCRSLCRFPSS